MTKEQLFADWLYGRVFRIGECSTDFARDYRALLPVARQVAELLSIPWSDDLLPDDVRERLSLAAEDAGDCAALEAWQAQRLANRSAAHDEASFADAERLRQISTRDDS